jgi:V8-like Glu-specific endopeptidase
MKLKFLPILYMCIGLSLSGFAQVSQGGQPKNWADKHIPSEIPIVSTSTLDFQALANEDAVVDLVKEAPYRFGVEVPVNYTMQNSGNWIIDANSDIAIWQLGVYCPEGVNISFILDKFDIPSGAKLFVWNEDRSQFLGSFTKQNTNNEKTLGIGILEGDKVYLEYQVPVHSKTWGEIEIGTIVHGYRSVLRSDAIGDENRGPFGNSGACNNNVNCPVGADWQIEKRSVAMIVEGGNALCTGALVNNTAQDGTPYFLTANHCLGGNLNNWVFYFNHESANCNGTTGPTNQSISGAVLRASNAGSDFALLELNSVPPASYNVQYAGWDNSDSESAVTNAVAIHHPSGDLKKISFEEDAPYHDNAAGAQVWFIDNWEDGVTEGGSSGSPLFNQDHRVIGQLYGGLAACSGTNDNNQYDYYGRFGVSWDNGSTNSTRLSNWLDPLGTGQTVLDGYPEGFVVAQYDAGVSSISGIAANICGSQGTPSFVLRNQGSETLTSCTIVATYNGTAQPTINWTGSLAQNAQVVLNLPVMNFVDGTNSITVTVSNPNNNPDAVANNNTASYSFTAATGDTQNLNIEIELDNYPDETSWELTNAQGAVVASSNGTYANQDGGDIISVSVCLAEGCYDFTIFDEYGDGLCFFGQCGSYTVTNEAGDVLASGADFNDFETTEVCLLPIISVEETEKTDMTIYPNPAAGFVRIEGVKGTNKITLFDMTGKLLLQEAGSDRVTFDTSKLADGCYFVRVEGQHAVKTQKLIVKK